MKVYTMEQRSDEWFDIRKGKITASVAGKLVTPTGKPSIQYKGEIGRIIAESLNLQEPEFIHPTYWMERGIEMEDESRKWFQVETGRRVTECGFIEHDSGLAGFSPDGYIMDDDLLIPLELKNPKPSTHIKYLIDGGLPKEHIAQCHFALAITNAPYMYFQSYCPNTPILLMKVETSDYTDLMHDKIGNFITELAAAQKLITGDRNENDENPEDTA